MKKLILILFAAVSLSAMAANTAVKGYLVDLACAKENAEKPDPKFPAKHSKDCLQMPECVKAGYGVMTADKKVTVIWKGRRILDGYQVANYSDHRGQLVLMGRTGGNNQNVHFDNLHLITVPATEPLHERVVILRC